LFFSSRNLLKNIILQAGSCSTKYLCIDGTYRLTVLGYPLLVIGTQDITHKFRLVALALSKHEREKDYKFVLDSVRNSLEMIFKYEWRIDLLLSDASMAIYSAAALTFSAKYTHGMCSVHFRRNVEKNNIFSPCQGQKSPQKRYNFSAKYP